MHKRIDVLVLYVQKECFEVYALVPGLLREEVCVLYSFLYLFCIMISQSFSLASYKEK